MKHHIDTYGRLVITGQPDPDARDLYDALEPLTCNSDLDWINPAESGDLTDAPILGIRDEEGKPTDQRWGYMDYQIKDPLEELRKHGQITFQAAT